MTKGKIMESWYVYIAKSRTYRYYVGISKDVDERIKRHNSRRGSRLAVNQGLFSLVYKSEPFGNKIEARKREMQIKGWTRHKKEKLVNGEWL
jgi:predicted GIY-YIG superfamily endonuclease